LNLTGFTGTFSFKGEIQIKNKNDSVKNDSVKNIGFKLIRPKFERSHLYKNLLRSFLKSLTFREWYCSTTKRFRPLDHRGVASAFYYYFIFSAENPIIFAKKMFSDLKLSYFWIVIKVLCFLSEPTKFGNIYGRQSGDSGIPDQSPDYRKNAGQ